MNHVCISLPGEDFNALHAQLEERNTPVSEFSYDAFGARGNARRSF